MWFGLVNYIYDAVKWMSHALIMTPKSLFMKEEEWHLLALWRLRWSKNSQWCHGWLYSKYRRWDKDSHLLIFRHNKWCPSRVFGWTDVVEHKSCWEKIMSGDSLWMIGLQLDFRELSMTMRHWQVTVPGNCMLPLEWLWKLI